MVGEQEYRQVRLAVVLRIARCFRVHRDTPSEKIGLHLTRRKVCELFGRGPLLSIWKRHHHVEGRSIHRAIRLSADGNRLAPSVQPFLGALAVGLSYPRAPAPLLLLLASADQASHQLLPVYP